MAHFLVLFCAKEDRGRTHYGVLVLSGMKGKPLFCLQRVSIQPRAQCFSGEVNETEKVGFRKEESRDWEDGNRHSAANFVPFLGGGLLRFPLNIYADLPNTSNPISPRLG
jgi:hypothetical protein